MQAVRDCQRADLADEAVNAVAGHDDVAVDERANGLDGEQRNPLCLRRDRRAGFGRHVGNKRIDQLIHGGRVQRVEREQGPVTPAAPPGAGRLELRVGGHAVEVIRGEYSL